MVGGACRTEYPFSKVPGLGHSTGAYLLGVMPPELIQVCVSIDVEFACAGCVVWVFKQFLCAFGWVGCVS